MKHENAIAEMIGALVIEQGDTAHEMLAELMGDDAPEVSGVSSFVEAGVLTSDAGLVIKLSDNVEVQLTVNRSA